MRPSILDPYDHTTPKLLDPPNETDGKESTDLVVSEYNEAVAIRDFASKYCSDYHHVQITDKQLKFILYCCKYDEVTGRWLTDARAYNMAYGGSNKNAHILASRLRNRPMFSAMIKEIRENILKNLIDTVVMEGVAVKANRIKKQSETWERLMRLRDAMLPAGIKIEDYPDAESFVKAAKAQLESDNDSAKLWSEEIQRILRMIGEVEDRVAAELGQRNTKNLGQNALKAYSGFDAEAV